MSDLPPRDRPITFFVPGEIFLLVDHNRPLNADELTARLRQHPLIQSDERLARAVEMVDASSVVTTTRAAESEATGCNLLVSLLLRLFNLSRDRMPMAAAQQSRYFSTVFANVGRVDDALVTNPRAFFTEFIEPLYRRSKTYARGGDDDLTIQAISPNWLLSVSQGTWGSGGPGARPVPPAEMPDGKRSTPPWTFTLSGRTDFEGQPVTPQAVDVAVLDTAPPQAALQEALTRFSAEDNPLLHELLAPGSRLTVVHDNSPMMAALNSHTTGVGLVDHDYLMTDHGLFVAGIIATLAPDAQIQLIQVLNDFGVGTVQTIANGLNRLLAVPRTHPLVVNLSLTLNIPLGKYTRHQKGHLEYYADWLWLEDWLDRNPNFVRDSIATLERLCDELDNQGVLLVAAAGNDGEGGKRPEPRWPAAFKNVHGVAALNHAGQPADYSNLADLPARSGIITFGGDAVNGKADPYTGVLGLYIGQFPDGTPSQTGWGRWAGTSFAAPVVAGTLARLISLGHSPAAALDRVYRVEHGTTPTQEEILNVTQG